jgi:hypothetical protein
MRLLVQDLLASVNADTNGSSTRSSTYLETLCVRCSVVLPPHPASPLLSPSTALQMVPDRRRDGCSEPPPQATRRGAGTAPSAVVRPAERDVATLRWERGTSLQLAVVSRSLLHSVGAHSSEMQSTIQPAGGGHGSGVSNNAAAGAGAAALQVAGSPRTRSVAAAIGILGTCASPLVACVGSSHDSCT